MIWLFLAACFVVGFATTLVVMTWRDTKYDYDDEEVM